MSEMRFVDDAAAQRFALYRDEELVSILDYRDDGHSVALTRAYTVPSFRGHGWAGELVAWSVAELERRGGRSVVPVCWYVAEWFDAHPEHRGILRARSA